MVVQFIDNSVFILGMKHHDTVAYIDEGAASFISERESSTTSTSHADSYLAKGLPSLFLMLALELGQYKTAVDVSRIRSCR
jgi:hypothetical protein